MKFRHDINALRALAVTAVVLFHYKVNFVLGGFVGVDIFFVISGYLMTNIIAGRLAKGSFSIWEFYGDRAKRIVPGLLGLCFGLLAAGYFVLDPFTYRTVGSAAIGALLFVSNFQFWDSISYFNPESANQWLLHSWSLSVEWQYYLIYPIMVLGLHVQRTMRRYLVPILWLLAASSFLLCVWSSAFHPASAFYLLPQRAWELLAGAIVALQFKDYQWKHPSRLIGAGFLFVGIAIFAYDSTMSWPSYWASLPVIGTCLIIAANQPGAQLFKNRLIQTVGKWSYSIYLWHWPIVVAASYFYFVKTTALKIGCELVILTAILAAGGLFLSLIRRNWTRFFVEGDRRPAVAFGAAALVLAVAFAHVVSKDGLISRRPELAKDIDTYAKAAQDWNFPEECMGADSAGNLRPCRLGRADDRGVLFIGDSFAMHLYGRFAEAAKFNPESSFTFVASPGCPPVTRMRYNLEGHSCHGFFEKALQFAKMHQFKRVVLSSRWNAYFRPKEGWMCFETSGGCRDVRNPAAYYPLFDAALADLRSRLRDLKDGGAEIVILWASPGGEWNVPSELTKRKFLGLDTKDVEFVDRLEFEKNAAPIKSRLADLASAIGAKFIDPFEFLCDSRRCPTVDPDGVPYYIDDQHIGARFIKTARYQYLDDAAGIVNRVSAARRAADDSPKF
ncbi:MAG TPA: acyltransferase family protein [Methylocella sp.]|nr:acyltransferase family protein [Methylocella sp.]